MSYVDNNRPTGIQENAAEPTAETNVVIPPAKEMHVSYSEYEASVQSFLFTCVISIVVFAFLSALPALFIWAAIDTYNDSYNMSVSVPAVVILIASIIILVFFIGLCKAIGESFSSMMEKKKHWRSTAEKCELRKGRKKGVMRIAVICILICAIAGPIIAIKENEKNALENTYNTALQQIDDGAYQEAYSTLRSIQAEEYKDTESLMDLCQAHIYYKNENAFAAMVYMNGTEFNFLTAEQQRKIDEFNKELQILYNKQRREREAREKAQAEERRKNSVPFVGMAESRIGNTSLGAPAATVRHNSEIRHNTLCHFNLYDWYRNGQMIFSVRCLDGTVTEVWDYRDNPITPYKPKSGSKKVYDYPDYDDYLDAEDLYDWYYDDFYDYEEAEEYLDDWD